MTVRWAVREKMLGADPHPPVNINYSSMIKFLLINLYLFFFLFTAFAKKIRECTYIEKEMTLDII